MATLLHVKSSVFGDDAQSALLARHFIERWKSENVGAEVISRDLVSNPLPHLDMTRISALMSSPDQRSPQQQKIVDEADALLKEVQSADVVLLAVPMYNFSIPSQLKSYFDHLARAGVTFKYTDKGPVGLLQDKPVYLLATRGGLYHEAGQDFEVPFVKQFLGFIGLHDVRVVLAEGLNMGEETKQAALEAALKSLEA